MTQDKMPDEITLHQMSDGSFDWCDTKLHDIFNGMKVNYTRTALYTALEQKNARLVEVSNNLVGNIGLLEDYFEGSKENLEIRDEIKSFLDEWVAEVEQALAENKEVKNDTE